jgi:hypothetical protein
MGWDGDWKYEQMTSFPLRCQLDYALSESELGLGARSELRRYYVPAGEMEERLAGLEC